MDDETVDPQDLDPETLEKVKYAIRGFRLADPSKAPPELDAYSRGKHEGYASVMGMLTRWLDELEDQDERG